MSRHIIGTFERMLILRTIFRDEAIEDGFHVHTNLRVCILIDAQSATGMLAEYADDASLRQLRQLTHYLTCHQMKAARLGDETYFYLLYHRSILINNPNNEGKITNNRAKMSTFVR